VGQEAWHCSLLLAASHCLPDLSLSLSLSAGALCVSQAFVVSTQWIVQIGITAHTLDSLSSRAFMVLHLFAVTKSDASSCGKSGKEREVQTLHTLSLQHTCLLDCLFQGKITKILDTAPSLPSLQRCGGRRFQILFEADTDADSLRLIPHVQKSVLKRSPFVILKLKNVWKQFGDKVTCSHDKLIFSKFFKWF